MKWRVSHAQTYERQLAVAAGWGITESGDISDLLRQVELNIIPNATCVENLSALNIQVKIKFSSCVLRHLQHSKSTVMVA